MLRFLFPRLTADSRRGQALFDTAVAEARRPFWYVDAEVPDTIDGRFGVLSTVCAMLIVKLESCGEQGEAASAALTERFIEAMDAEHRELGMNDPGLGRKVRKLVGALARRVGEWRSATEDRRDWEETVLSSMYRGSTPSENSLRVSSEALRDLWTRLSRSTEQQLIEGRL